MGWKNFLKEYNMGLGKNIYLLKNLRGAVVDYIQTLGLKEEDETRLIEYITDEIYVKKLYTYDMKQYVSDTMGKLDIQMG